MLIESYESMEWYLYAIAFLGGLFAGSLNTLSGNGSAITITILTEIIGLPGNLANGTNRLGVFTQGIASTIGFLKTHKFHFKRDRALIILTTLGAIGGFVLAISVSNEEFKTVFKYLMILMLFSLLIRPKKWLIESTAESGLSKWIAYPLFVAIGFYGGFIQMGTGILFLIVMVLGVRYSLMDANFLKAFIFPFYTVIGIIVFHFQGLIHWEFGLVMALGQIIGGYWTAFYAAKNENAKLWAYRLLIVAMVLALVKLFNLHTFFL